MRLLRIALLCLPFFYSCETTTPEPPTSNNVLIGPQPKFEYKANGVLINLDAVYDARIGYLAFPSIFRTGSNSYYFSSGGNEYAYGVSQPNALNFFILTNVITQTTYSCTGSDSKFGGLSHYSGNQTVTITRVNNGYADGTFSGTIIRTNAPVSTVTITEGKFSNLPIIN
jgi:hypothetical protein